MHVQVFREQLQFCQAGEPGSTLRSVMTPQSIFREHTGGPGSPLLGFGHTHLQIALRIGKHASTSSGWVASLARLSQPIRPIVETTREKCHVSTSPKSVMFATTKLRCTRGPSPCVVMPYRSLCSACQQLLYSLCACRVVRSRQHLNGGVCCRMLVLFKVISGVVVNDDNTPIPLAF